MGKKTESKISLSLKDLERLGVIKKRLKRKRKNKKLTKVLDALIGGQKSDSSHMKGYTNHFANTSNLTTEGQRLHNQLLGETHDKQRKELEYDRKKNEEFQNNTKAFQNNTREVIAHMMTTKYNPYKTIEDEDRFEEIPDSPEAGDKTRFTDTPTKTFYNPSDNIDVTKSISSGDFQGSPVPTKSHLESIDESIKSMTPPISTQSPLLQNNRFTLLFNNQKANKSGLFSSPLTGIFSPSQTNENPLRPSPSIEQDETDTKPSFSLQNPSKPTLKRQTTDEKYQQFVLEQEKYIADGIPSPVVYNAENKRQLNSLPKKYELFKQYKELGGDNEYYLDNINHMSTKELKAIMEQQKRKKK
jgi:hypothetical protein